MAKERRRSSRFTIQHVIELSYGRESYVSARGINISKTGLLCTTDTYIEPYTTVLLAINVPVGPDGDTINCEGMVIRSSEAGEGYTTAISFMSFREKDAEALVAFLGNRESRSAE